MNKKLIAILFAILAAGLYAINIPLSKLLLNYIESTMMASYLYLGAGIGIGIFFNYKKQTQRNTRKNIKKRFAQCFRNDSVRYGSAHIAYVWIAR